MPLNTKRCCNAQWCPNNRVPSRSKLCSRPKPWVTNNQQQYENLKDKASSLFWYSKSDTFFLNVEDKILLEDNPIPVLSTRLQWNWSFWKVEYNTDGIAQKPSEFHQSFVGKRRKNVPKTLTDSLTVVPNETKGMCCYRSLSHLS